MVGRLIAAFRRCKRLDSDEDSAKDGSGLSRCLTLFDLTALGVGSTLGLGVYVLAGAVAKSVAGPAVTLSFLVAAIASAFAGVCYAEFAARVPKAGSAYVYSYVSVGEFVAFTIGWNLVLEYMIGTASVAKGMANYVDSLCGGAMAKALTDVMPIRLPFLAEFPDFFAFGIVILITVLLAMGVKESSKLNNVFTAFNIITVLVVVISGSIISNPGNWRIKIENIPVEYQDKAGVGGFMPWGVAGVMAGAAKCFFGFVGFDCVATTGEEAINPRRDIPLSILLSLVIIFGSYFSVATVLTMMWPYYLQDAEAPFPHAFNEAGLPAVAWLVTVGAVFALCTSLLGAMFPLPRVLYAMASDGLLFRPLDRINKKTRTPVIATILSGFCAAILAAIFNLDQLIEMLSIGTLLAYTIVSISVLILRYEESTVSQTEVTPSLQSALIQSFNLHGIKRPTKFSASIAKTTICLYFVVSLIGCVFGRCAEGNTYIIGVSVSGAAMLILLILIYRQPQNAATHLTFAVPCIPLVPFLSMTINVYLMIQLDVQTWVRFVVWMTLGYLIYFIYGIRSSLLNIKPAETKEEVQPTKR